MNYSSAKHMRSASLKHGKIRNRFDEDHHPKDSNAETQESPPSKASHRPPLPSLNPSLPYFVTAHSNLAQQLTPRSAFRPTGLQLGPGRGKAGRSLSGPGQTLPQIQTLPPLPEREVLRVELPSLTLMTLLWNKTIRV